MKRPRVYVHRAGHWYPMFMDARNEAALHAVADVVRERDDGPLPAPHVVERLRGCDAILSLNGYGSGDVTTEALRSAGTVRVICIAHWWGQFAGLPPDAGVRVVEGSNAGTVAVAEWIVTAALMGVRRLHEFDREMKLGSPWGEPRRRAGMLAGSIVGMAGLGRIGRYAARQLNALGAVVIAASASCPPAEAEAMGVQLVPLDVLLRTADVVSLNYEVTPATRGRIGARELSMLRDGCVFINAARSALTDERALVAELRTGRISAFLDVFDEEPLPAKHPFRTLPNVVITPHVAGNNAEMFRRCGREAIATLAEHFGGGDLRDHRHRYP